MLNKQRIKFMKIIFGEKNSEREAVAPRGRGARSCNLANARSRSAFSLVETIIYIALFSGLASFVIVVFYQLIGGSEQHKNRVEVDTEANFMMQKMVWAITGAKKINQPTGGATSTSLSLNKFNYAENPIVFDMGINNLRLSKASSTPTLIGSSRVFVNQALFEHIPAVQSSPEGVKITLKVVSSDISRPQASTTLQNTIYLR